MADWDNNAIVRLMLTNFSDDEGYSKWSKPDCKYTIEELGLYEEGDDITLNLIDLFNEFNKRKIELDMERQNNADKEKYQQYINLLEKNYNLILTGAPGTGKTYMAHKIAEAMGAIGDCVKMVQFHPSYDYTDFVEGLRPTENEHGQATFERRDGVFKEFCKHALKSQKIIIDNFEECWNKLIDYLSNNDFIDVPLISDSHKTIRIELNEYDNGLANRTYLNGEYKKDEWIKGKSKFFSKDQLYNVYRGMKGVPQGGHDNYRKAIINYMLEHFGLQKYQVEDLSNQKYVFIIDEINRGEISKIFGELFFSIDPGYRGKKGQVCTQYQNLITDDDDEFKQGFFIPENVYIIGTMNDIDRSVESMDFAMRRRFAWKEVTAKESQKMFETHNDFKQLDDSVKTEIVNRMDNLNAAIIGEYKYDSKEIKKIGTLNKDYQIGAAYFLKYLSYKDEGMPFDVLWENNLKILLYDYVRADQNPDEELKLLKKAYDDNKPANNSNKQNNEPNDSDK